MTERAHSMRRPHAGIGHAVRRAILGLASALVGLGAAAGFAADGRGEIDMVAVSDAGGFPFVIAQPGSYVLTGDLRVANANTTAIQITADDVTLDLNGFSISGVTECSSTTTVTTCSPTGSGIGIDISSTATNVAVRNGTVRGMGSLGISSSPSGTRIEELQVVSNGSSGLSLGPDATITGCKASRNQSIGLEANDGSLFARNATADNGFFGFSVFDYSVLSGNTGTNNHADGIDALLANVIRNSTSNSSTGIGIDSSDGSVIRQNALRQNGNVGIRCFSGCTARQNTVETSGRAVAAAGLSFGSGVTILGNSSRLNTGTGILAGTATGHGDNVTSDNSGGSIGVGAPSVQVGCNLLNGAQSCPTGCGPFP